jgi:hypothetical protein
LAGVALILPFLDTQVNNAFSFPNPGAGFDTAVLQKTLLGNTIADFCTTIQRSDFESLPVQ